MEIIVDKGCGLDVRKETVVACIMGTGIKRIIDKFIPEDGVFSNGIDTPGMKCHWEKGENETRS